MSVLLKSISILKTWNVRLQVNGWASITVLTFKILERSQDILFEFPT